VAVEGRFDARDACCTLTLPTGIGKTLLAASWALEMRESMRSAQGVAPRIFVVLPFLSIVDQTEREYRAVLGLDADERSQSELLMASHSVSQREYETEGELRGRREADFFLDTWRSEIVVTTFDQLLLALFSPRTRHQMRFHRLLDALIVLDEVQALPCRLWDLVDHGLRALTQEGHAKVLMMSATQPALLTGARELAGSPDELAEAFRGLRRYSIDLQHRDVLGIDAWLEGLEPRLRAWVDEGERVLLTLNTRGAARRAWCAVGEVVGDGAPLHFLTADVTPRDRLAKIAAIRRGGPCIVVSTQTIEAGVDIDMSVVVRDFGPFDAIVQIAGRCNRNNRLGDHGGAVELIRLESDRGRPFAEMVYDRVLLDATHEVLGDRSVIAEEQVFELGRRYFEILKARKDTGRELTETFARWGEMPDIRAELRGAGREQVSFFVAGDDSELLERLRGVLEITDRWERRTALRALAGEIQSRSVTVFARPELHPEDYAEALGPFWVLDPRWYTAEGGLDLELDREDPVCIF